MRSSRSSSFNSAVQAEERIEQFTSDAQVNVDGSVDVTETISVNAESRQIRRGIFRDFPTTYTDRNGLRVVVGFEVISVKRDRQPEPYAIEGLSNGKRIRIGSADVFLDPGIHVYEIQYRTTRQLGFFADYDELYWNVTGNGWTIPHRRRQPPSCGSRRARESCSMKPILDIRAKMAATSRCSMPRAMSTAPLPHGILPRARA